MNGQSLSPGGRLQLPEVTLCAVTSVNLPATVRALKACLAQIDFGRCKLLTDAEVKPGHPEIVVTAIPPLRSSAAYSDFMLRRLADHIDTPYCLVAQWDGHVIDAGRWQDAFLQYDYIGARWPQFSDGRVVGNGGFSLRSARLLAACRASAFECGHPEDLAIGRRNREWLGTQGIRFASPEMADEFAAERAGNVRRAFGYHGVFNMPAVLGPEAFWEVYRDLDDRSTLRPDFWLIAKALARGPHGARRVTRALADRLTDAI